MNGSDYYKGYARTIHRALRATVVSRDSGKTLEVGAGLTRLCDLAKKTRRARGTLFFCGNGASAAMAAHMALDWLKAAGVRAIAFNDGALLTAVGNDLGYENAFALPLERLGSAKDVLVTVSSSGNSPSILRAIEEARRIGMTVVTFSGLKPDNRSRKLGTYNFYVPSRTYGIAECTHQILLHAWIDRFMGIAEF